MRKPPSSLQSNAGFTLVEIMMVVFAIVALLGILTLALGPVRGIVHKSMCISNQRTVQDAARLYAAANGLNYNASLSRNTLIGSGKLVPITPICKAGGTYSYRNRVPPIGTRFLTCNSSSGHAPSSAAGW